MAKTIMTKADYEAILNTLNERPKKVAFWEGYSVASREELDRLAGWLGYASEGLASKSDDEAKADDDFALMDHDALGDWLKDRGIAVPRSKADRLAEARRVAAKAEGLASKSDDELLDLAHPHWPADYGDVLTPEDRETLLKRLLAVED